MKFRFTEALDRVIKDNPKVDLLITRVDVETKNDSGTKVFPNLGDVELLNLGEGAIKVTVIINNSSIREEFLLGSVKIYGKVNESDIEEMLIFSESDVDHPCYIHSIEHGEYIYRFSFDINVKCGDTVSSSVRRNNMKIRTKYHIGDKVKVLADPVIETTCPFCKGKYSIEVEGKIFHCQNCYGGELRDRVYERRQLVEGVITAIKLEVKDANEINWKYNSECNNQYRRSENLAIREEYVVKVSKEYWGNELYEVRDIVPITPENENSDNQID